MSDTLATLRRIESQLAKSKRFLSLELLGLGLDDGSYRYAITPPDLLTFAATGGAGIHFGFLTDFGAETDLDSAWIVCVSPTNDPPLKIVTRNIIDFLSLVRKISYAESLDDVNSLVDENEWIADIKAKRSEPDSEFIVKSLEEQLPLRRIQSVYDYLGRIRAERERSLSYRTIDGIGVLRTEHTVDDEVKDYSYDFRRDEVERMRSYLEHASYDEKLAFCRTTIFSFVLAPGYDHELQILVADALDDLELLEESRNVRGNI